MLNFLKNKAKFIFIIYLIVLFCTLLFGTFYSTQYSNIHFAYSFTGDTVEINSSSRFSELGKSNSDVWNYFSNATDKIEELDSLYGRTNRESNFENSGKKFDIYNFQISLSSFNSKIILFTFISIICVAILFVFGNHSRKVYYKSNLIIGILIPCVIIAFSIVLFVGNSNVMSLFSANELLFRVVGVFMDSNTGTQVARQYRTDHQALLNASSSINNTSFIILDVLLIVVVLYSILVIVYTIFRYKESTNKRNEIIERAAKNND